MAEFKNIKDYIEFQRRVDTLWEPDYEELELEEFPTTVGGGFAPWRVEEFLRLARLHPEFHIVTCIDTDLFINSFVWGALTYYLAQGDADPKLVHDPYDRLDAYFLQTLNSGRKRHSA
jgi:hypothetical protein